MQNKKKTTVTIVVVVVATLLFPLIGLQQQKVDAQNSSIFTTYTNPELGYSINYPSDWNKQHFPYFSTV
jgi:hypothetical protein